MSRALKVKHNSKNRQCDQEITEKARFVEKVRINPKNEGMMKSEMRRDVLLDGKRTDKVKGNECAMIIKVRQNATRETNATKSGKMRQRVRVMIRVLKAYFFVTYMTYTTVFILLKMAVIGSKD